MSDVVDIQSQYSEIDDDALTNALKDGSKHRKGRGFVKNAGSELRGIRVFDRLEDAGKIISRTAHQPQGSVEGWVIFVTGIHDEATEEDVKELFSEHGLIKNLVLNLDRRTGYIKGHALIEYEKYQEAIAAIENLNEGQLLGQTIRVHWCFTKGPNLVSYKYLSTKYSSGSRYNKDYK